MEAFLPFLKALLSHWGWLMIAFAAFFLYWIVGSGEDDRVRLVFILIGVGCIVVALLLTVGDQWSALNQYLG
jgi:hypothetical protein